MPRPIPDDVENVSGFIWYLIPIPDDPVFVQAAWDAFSELTYPWNWGKEGRVPDSDIAAQLWSDAIYEALRVRDMGFPDNILTAVDEVEGLLRDILLASCCANTSVTGDSVTSDIEPDVGDPPTTWGDQEPVSSWQEWRELVCGATDAWVTSLQSDVDTLESYLDLGLLTIGVVVGILSAAAGAGILIAIEYGVAVEAFGALVANGNDLVFGNIKSGLETKRADIRCAIFEGCAELEAEIQAAVGTLAWTTWYQFHDWCSIRNSLLEGQFEGGFHAVNPSSLCDGCGQAEFLAATFDLVNGNFFVWDGVSSYVDYNWNATPYDGTTGAAIRCKGGGDDRLTFSVSQDVSGTPRQLMDIDIDVSGLTQNVIVQTFLNSGTAIHNQSHSPAAFPLNFSGIDGIRLESAELANDVDVNKYALLTVNGLS